MSKAMKSAKTNGLKNQPASGAMHVKDGAPNWCKPESGGTKKAGATRGNRGTPDTNTHGSSY